MREYNGIAGDSIEHGGSYNNESTGKEVCNFSSIRGNVFGYVRPTGQIKIEKLGVDENASSVSGVTVVWTAGPETGGTAIIGWYKNATVFRDRQELHNKTKIQKENELSDYRIKAKSEDVILLPPEERNLLIPRAIKGGIGQSNVWYADSPESKVHVQRVLKLIKNGFSEELPDVDRFMSGKEGNPRLIVHLQRERNQVLVKKKKKQVLNSTGKLKCEVCDFNFQSFFGEIGEGFCEVHHLQPLSKIDGEVNTTLEDLAIVCSNCHRILHRQNPMLTLSQLKKAIVKRT